MTPRTLQQLAAEHGIPLSTLHTRRKQHGVGTKYGSTWVFTAAEARRLVKVGKRGRPKRKGVK